MKKAFNTWGCPLSVTLLILVLSVEELAKAMRENKSIWMYFYFIFYFTFMNRERNQVCQYADDTALILDLRIPNGLSGSKLNRSHTELE